MLPTRCRSLLMTLALFGSGIALGELPPAAELPAVKELPDVLRMFDGTPVTTAEQWQNQRRPELQRLFQHYMYGYLPPQPKIAAKVTKTADVCDGKVALKEIEIRFADLPAAAPKIHLALFLPKNAAGPVPVFLGLNPCGNAELLDDDAITIDDSAWRSKSCGEQLTRGKAKDFWCVDYVTSRGYALATFHESDVDPDQHDFTDGIHPFYADRNVPEKSRPGTIAAWAWGLSRAVDYLVTDPQIDAEKVCLIGHSRRGKTALFAAAMDDRVALVVPHQSGTGGMALTRDTQQETAERINRVFPHWFSDSFTEFDAAVERLPFDQHCLVALVAPRPLLDTEGGQDAWANFPRSLDALQAADAVYKLLGAPGLNGTGLVQDDEPIVGPNFGTILQYRQDIGHTLNQKFWEKILDFADAQLNSPRK